MFKVIETYGRVIETTAWPVLSRISGIFKPAFLQYSTARNKNSDYLGYTIDDVSDPLKMVVTHYWTEQGAKQAFDNTTKFVPKFSLIYQSAIEKLGYTLSFSIAEDPTPESTPILIKDGKF